MQSKSHRFVVNKKIAAVVPLIIFLPIVTSFGFFLSPNFVLIGNNHTYTCQQYAPEQGQKIVCMVFDDGWQSQWENAIPVLDRYGFKASFAIITGYVDDKLPAYMSWSEIVKLAKNGEDIVSHSYSHQPLATLDNASINYQLSQSKADLNRKGISSPVFVYPSGSGAGNAVVESFVQKYYMVARGITNNTLNLSQPFDRYNLPSYTIRNTTSLNVFKNIVNNANDSEVVMIYYHKINRENVETATTPEMFASEMQYLYENNFTVMTMTQLFLKEDSQT
jgi:peptidoglycan/xylan/chitin deacetylase (PgdA/CDA1 family)